MNRFLPGVLTHPWGGVRTAPVRHRSPLGAARQIHPGSESPCWNVVVNATIWKAPAVPGGTDRATSRRVLCKAARSIVTPPLPERPSVLGARYSVDSSVRPQRKGLRGTDVMWSTQLIGPRMALAQLPVAVVAWNLTPRGIAMRVPPKAALDPSEVLPLGSKHGGRPPP